MTLEQAKLPVKYQEFAPKKVRDYLRAHVLDGATARYLEDESVQPGVLKARIRGHYLTVLYFSDGLTLEEFGRKYGGGISRERVRQIVNETFKGLNTYASEDIQNRYPFKEIPKNKKGQLNTLIERGLRRGNKAPLIADLSRKGVSRLEIEKIIGTSNIRDVGISYVGRDGLNIPFSKKHDLSLEIRQEVKDVSLTFEQVQDLWIKTNLSVARRLTKEGLAFSLNDLAGFAGIHIRPAQLGSLIPYIEKTEIALGHYQRVTKDKKGERLHQNYYFLRKVDLNRAIKALAQVE